MALTCDIRRSGPTASYGVERTWVGVPLSGVFSIHARGEEVVIHPALGVVFPSGIEYRMSHPTDDGDASLAFAFAPEVLEEALPAHGEHVRATMLDLRLRYAVTLLGAAIDRGEDGLVIDDIALALLHGIAVGVTHVSFVGSARARQRVDRVRTLIAEDPAARWTLQELGRRVGWSPFHLAHQFRALAGTSVHRYLAVVRAAAALERIERGDASLAAVAADLGYAHHSHLTSSLRRQLGMTPRAIRASLARRH